MEKSKKIVNAPIDFVSLESETESKEYLLLLSQVWMSEIEKKWTDKEWGMYDNAHYDICEKICNDVYSTSKYWEKSQSHTDFLNKLTKEQRMGISERPCHPFRFKWCHFERSCNDIKFLIINCF